MAFTRETRKDGAIVTRTDAGHVIDVVPAKPQADLGAAAKPPVKWGNVLKSGAVMAAVAYVAPELAFAVGQVPQVIDAALVTLKYTTKTM